MVQLCKWRWRWILMAVTFKAVLFFSEFNGISAQESFPKSVLRLAKSTFCNCLRDCIPGDLEPDSMCFSACDCFVTPIMQIKRIAQCEGEHCTCRRSTDRACPLNARRVCMFEDGIVCEFEKKYCVDHTDLSSICKCKDGWSGPDCLTCDSCQQATLKNNKAAVILGAMLAIVVVVFVCVVIVYCRLGRLPCQKDKRIEGPRKPGVSNAYFVSQPITGHHGPGKVSKMSPPDADTGEIDGEYAYAAINEYAIISEQDRAKPAVPTGPVPSVPAANVTEDAHFYFKLRENEKNKLKKGVAPTTTTADCYTKVIRKPKADKPPSSQYDHLDRTNLRPHPNEENVSPSDNEYGKLATSTTAKDSSNGPSQNNTLDV